VGKGNLSPATLRVLRNTISLDCHWTALKPGVEFLTPEDTLSELRTLLASSSRGDAMQVDEEDGDDASLPMAVRTMKSREANEALSALGAMVIYLRELNLDKDVLTCGNFNVYDPLLQGNALVLDGQTLAHIEVLQNSLGTDEGTLLRLLSRCVTPFGEIIHHLSFVRGERLTYFEYR
jgi:DNA mismatch repair protein MSH6